jgi:hypothetical protein
MAEDSTTLSTSALAKRLKLPMQQLFVTLRDYGWIERKGKTWELTGKGQLHGGAYQDSQRFGRYIVWPETLIEHPLLIAIESNQRITAGGMCRYYGHLSVRQINRNFAELGLIRFSSGGIKLTHLGERFGGRQEREEDNGLLVVNWPHEIVDNPVIHRELNRLIGDGLVSDDSVSDGVGSASDVASSDESSAIAPDLFADAPGAASSEADDKEGKQSVREQRYGLDGHAVNSLLQLRVCDWLYEAQLAHAHNRQLPVEEPLTADFYVPSLGLYIECWERDVPTASLTRRLRTREVCRELKLPYQEIAASDIERIDDLLSARVTELSSGR